MPRHDDAPLGSDHRADPREPPPQAEGPLRGDRYVTDAVPRPRSPREADPRRHAQARGARAFLMLPDAPTTATLTGRTSRRSSRAASGTRRGTSATDDQVPLAGVGFSDRPVRRHHCAAARTSPPPCATAGGAGGGGGSGLPPAPYPSQTTEAGIHRDEERGEDETENQVIHGCSPFTDRRRFTAPERPDPYRR